MRINNHPKYEFQITIDDHSEHGEFWFEDKRGDNMNDMNDVCLHFRVNDHHTRITVAVVQELMQLCLKYMGLKR